MKLAPAFSIAMAITAAALAAILSHGRATRSDSIAKPTAGKLYPSITATLTKNHPNGWRDHDTVMETEFQGKKVMVYCRQFHINESGYTLNAGSWEDVARMEAAIRQGDM